MKSVNATLSANMAAGTGLPIARATIGGADYDLISYAWNNLQLTCAINAPITPSLNASILLKRGLKIGATEYLETAGTFYIESSEIQNGVQTKIKAHALPALAISSVDGNATLEAVLADVTTQIAVTFDAPANDWFDVWRFYEAGKTVNLPAAKFLQSMITQKRRAHLFLRQSHIWLLNPGADDGTLTPTAYTLPSFYVAMQPKINPLVMWKYDDNNFYASVYADTDPAPDSAPSVNIGYFDDSIADSAIKPLGEDSGGARVWEQRPDLALEQGDALTISGLSGVRFVRFTEYYNPGRNLPWKQVCEDMQWQGVSAGATNAAPVTINNITEVTQNITQQVTNMYDLFQTYNQIVYETNYLGGNAAQIQLNTSAFDNHLGPADSNVQALAEKFDDHEHESVSWLLYQFYF